MFYKNKQNINPACACHIYLINSSIPLYNIYSTYIEIRLVETIPRHIYQNIV